MRQLIKNTLIVMLMVASVLGAGATLNPSYALAKPCNGGGTAPASSDFFGFPYWYSGLHQETVNGNCAIKVCPNTATACAADNYAGIWTIVLNIVNILLRLTGLIAVIFIIVGGARYIISQGDPGSISLAKQTIVRAITGLIISIASVLILNFIVTNVLHLTVNPNTYQVK